ncbi:uncharacterized protein LOC110183142 [Drosophila serrata]|uniref:uncharacterized protein LOC110183142 n=1 Tax=Drosophila serrata TaxID=7274 RepID=UPI000A1CF822|nr:uncharacterized protein LOC110183142 [Drosophila serrata]KAH8388140.1 hypothetical protein KR200_004663 [Drosophila serrata]
MTLLKKCCCFSLRTAALIIAYSTLIIEVLLWVWLFYPVCQICGDFLVLWVFAAIWNIFSAAILITAVHREHPKLIPLHLVMHLSGLILDMIGHLKMAAKNEKNWKAMTHAFIYIAFMATDIVIALSYYHSEI